MSLALRSEPFLRDPNASLPSRILSSDRERFEVSRPVALTAKPRSEGFDAARALAVIGVVYLHAVETPLLKSFAVAGTFGVPFYIFVALYFQTRAFNRDPHRSILHYLAARAGRLYVPFLAWSLIYLLARNLKQAAILHSHVVWPEWSDLWVGSAMHLWFLPFLLIVNFVAAILYRICHPRPWLWWSAIAAMLLAGVAVGFSHRPDWLNYSDGNEAYFFIQLFRRTCSVLLALPLAWMIAPGRSSKDSAENRYQFHVSPMIGLVGAMLTIGLVATQFEIGGHRLLRAISGAGWMLLALSGWSGPMVPALAALGRRGYGVYLAHVLFTEAFQMIAHRAGVPVSIPLDIATVTVGLAGAVILVHLLCKSRYTRWLAG